MNARRLLASLTLGALLGLVGSLVLDQPSPPVTTLGAHR